MTTETRKVIEFTNLKSIEFIDQNSIRIITSDKIYKIPFVQFNSMDFGGVFETITQTIDGFTRKDSELKLNLNGSLLAIDINTGYYSES